MKHQYEHLDFVFAGLDENNMARLRVTPDGKFIVFLGAYGNMHLISAKVGRVD